MQRIATRVFVGASVAFGVVGILFALTVPLEEDDSSDLSQLLFRLLASIGFVVLASFALSVAGKYLTGDSPPDP